jgi:hypothetical protein
VTEELKGPKVSAQVQVSAEVRKLDRCCWCSQLVRPGEERVLLRVERIPTMQEVTQLKGAVANAVILAPNGEPASGVLEVEREFKELSMGHMQCWMRFLADIVGMLRWWRSQPRSTTSLDGGVSEGADAKGTDR